MLVFREAPSVVTSVYMEEWGVAWRILFLGVGVVASCPGVRA